MKHIILILLILTSISSAKLNSVCKNAVLQFIKIESLKDNTLTVQASKETVRICIDTLPQDAVDEDVQLIKEIMNIGMLAEKELIK